MLGSRGDVSTSGSQSKGGVEGNRGGNGMGGGHTQSLTERNCWLNAYHDRLANIFARSDCILLCDVFGDQDKRLVVADSEQKKLKLWKGTTLEAELKLVDHPCALCSVYGDNSKKRIPALCVASGPHLYIYRNLRAYYKFTLPDLTFSDREKELWKVSIPVHSPCLTSLSSKQETRERPTTKNKRK